MKSSTWFKSKRGGSVKTALKDLGEEGEIPELQVLHNLENQRYTLGMEKNTKTRRHKKVEQGENRTNQQVKNVETVIFIPSTPNSELKERLQKADNSMVKLLNTPSAKFVERRGTTVIDDLGRTNPWSQDWFCPRTECEPCKGTLYLVKEAEKEALRKVIGIEGGKVGGGE